MQNLKNIGWDDFFQNQVSTDQLNNHVIARVIAEHKNTFTVKTENAESRATISGRFFHKLKRTADMPVVGDWVLLRKPVETTGIIEKIITRRTMLSRRAPDDRKTFGNDKEQAIVSNIDTVFIVSSLNQNFNLSRIERALALVYSSGASPIILLSKSDLCDDTANKVLAVEQIAFGVPVVSFSNITNANIEQIAGFITPGKTACLIGSSGVGKTSLTNTLCGLSEKTIAVRSSDDRGRHATTARSMYILDNGGMLIDTPGIREIGLLDGTDGIDCMYDDIEELTQTCKFSNCTHTSEPGCALLSAIENGALDERRLRNYFRLQRENRFQTDKAGAVRAKEEWLKKLSKTLRQMKQNQ